MSEHDRPTPNGDARCVEPAEPRPLLAGLVPPRDADRDAYRAWVAASPWPEVVFASAAPR